MARPCPSSGCSARAGRAPPSPRTSAPPSPSLISSATKAGRRPPETTPRGSAPACSRPRASVAVFALAADTEAEAKRLARSRDLWIVRLYTGRPGAFPSVEEAESYPYTEQEVAIAQHARRRTIAGAPEQVREH